MHDHHHHSHQHHPDLEDVALGYLIGRSVGQRPPNNSGDGGGGIGCLIFAAVLVGLADFGIVPAMWDCGGYAIGQAPVVGLVCYLLALIMAALYDWMSVVGHTVGKPRGLTANLAQGESGQSGEEGSRHTLPPMRNPPARR